MGLLGKPYSPNPFPRVLKIGLCPVLLYCDQEELVELFKIGGSLPNNILEYSNRINMEYNKYIN